MRSRGLASEHGNGGGAGGGTATTANGGSGGDAAGGADGTANGGSAGSSNPGPCGEDGTGVCIAPEVGCPVGLNLTQMGCDLGGGAAGSCCLPSGATFPCGQSMCDVATQVCQISYPPIAFGMPPAYQCKDLFDVCQAPGADCTCFDEAEWCLCGGSSVPCESQLQPTCDMSEGGFTFKCSHY